MSARKTPDFYRHPRLSFLHGLSPEYLDELEKQYREDPDSVAEDVAIFFDTLALGRDELKASGRAADEHFANEMRVRDLIEAYRMRGHLVAKVDPLELWRSPMDPHLELSDFELDGVDKSVKFKAADWIGLPPSNINEIRKRLEATYCQGIGVEYHYIRDENVRSWLRLKIEQNQNKTDFATKEKLSFLGHLYQATAFESFLQTNYTGQKRFSLEGAESLIPALNHAIQQCSSLGAKEIVIGMAHRGRLNVLANVMKKPFQEIFKEFEGAELPQMVDAMGDVKYHQGYSTDIEGPEGRSIHLSLAPNPSHLEWVNPVVEGVVRAKQDTKHNEDRNAVVPLLIHGDAAIIGQGVVAETLNLVHLDGYSSGGTVHVVINNQIGFTTLPGDSRSSLYCTDFGKAFQSPIFHVNGDRVEDVVHAVRLACEFRMKFNRDVFVDIWCYRKYGHNEGDEPRFTQPLIYERIEKHPSPIEIYSRQLKNDPKVDQEELKAHTQGFKEVLDELRQGIQNEPLILQADMFRDQWKGFELSSEQKMITVTKTGIPEEVFDRVVEAIHHIPEEIAPLRKYKRMLENRKKKIVEEDEIDWAVAEQLAFGSLMMEQTVVRLSGQDSIRGTFSQRHLAMRDINIGKRYYPLMSLSEDQAPLYCYDSPLSEAAVLGFDYGYSLAQPKALVLWEGQFGDFCNSAQVIIDQFIASAESKWYRMSGIALLLPHGYEGQGPEHSSARLERFLQLSAQNNWQVTYPTTPAQYFHLLRRQIHRKFRKPLVVMTPKSPLRMPEVVSKKKEFTDSFFENVLVEVPKSKKPKRVVLSTGKVYWALKKEAEEQKLMDDIMFIRIEQIYPLHKPKIAELAAKFNGDLPWVWVQEEPKNMGAWSFMRLNLLDMGIDLQYAGRPPAATPATGSFLKHEREQRQLIKEGLGL